MDLIWAPHSHRVAPLAALIGDDVGYRLCRAIEHDLAFETDHAGTIVLDAR